MIKVSFQQIIRDLIKTEIYNSFDKNVSLIHYDDNVSCRREKPKRFENKYKYKIQSSFVVGLGVGGPNEFEKWYFEVELFLNDGQIEITNFNLLK